MLDVNLVSAGRTRHYSVALAGGGGWEITIEENRSVQWHETLGDWHRVERTLTRLRHEVDDLLEQGWTLQGARGLM
ncbi:MAG: hypothetical protein U0Q55_06105 [Vicinamibacterales bacterium]